MKTYCSNLTREYRTGEYRVDAVVEEGGDTSAYSTTVSSDTLGDLTAEQLVLAALPEGGYSVREPNDLGMIGAWRSMAKKVLRYQRDEKMETSGAVTSVIGADGKNIVMDCRYNDKDNIEGLAKLMDLQGITEATITDFYNNKHTVTRVQIDAILVGMLAHVAGLIYEKWQKDVAVDACVSKLGIEGILGGDLFELYTKYDS